jgi:hypothetical protein
MVVMAMCVNLRFLQQIPFVSRNKCCFSLYIFALSFFFLNVFTSASSKCLLNQFYCSLVEFVDCIPDCRGEWDGLMRSASIAVSDHAKDIPSILHAEFDLFLSLLMHS